MFMFFVNALKVSNMLKVHMYLLEYTRLSV
jgi:hypothetical protein